MPALTVHPKGNRTRVLISSVFGPYAQNDEYGSRALNPMELYQNQVTRTQGCFGWTTRLIAPLYGRYIYAMLKKEEKRLAQGWVYEPASMCKKNAAAVALEKKHARHPRFPRLQKRWASGALYPVEVAHPITKEKG